MPVSIGVTQRDEVESDTAWGGELASEPRVLSTGHVVYRLCARCEQGTYLVC